MEQLTDSLDLVEERASSNAVRCAGEFGGNIAADSEGSLLSPNLEGKRVQKLVQILARPWNSAH